MQATGNSASRRLADPQASPAASREEIDSLVTWTLVRVARRVERMLVNLFADYDLTPVQFGVLAYLATGTQFTQSELARAVLIRPQSMNVVITEMVERGLLERVGPGGRGRPTPIQLTATGVELLDVVQPAVAWANSPERLGLDPARTAELNETLLDILHSSLPDELEVEYRAPGTSAVVDRAGRGRRTAP